MLDVARAIAEKQPSDTMEKVDILSALAEVALEREDIDTSLDDYLKALSMLERLAVPDNRHIAELNFRICLCLNLGSKGEEAIPYCQKAILVCKSRLQRLTNEIERSSGPYFSVSAGSQIFLTYNLPVLHKLLILLLIKKRKLRFSQIFLVNLKISLKIFSRPCQIHLLYYLIYLKMIAAKGKNGQTSGDGGLTYSCIGMMANSSGFESSTVSTAHTNDDSGATHLGVVGRGVKRVSLSSVERPAKKPTSADNGGSA